MNERDFEQDLIFSPAEWEEEQNRFSKSDLRDYDLEKYLED